MYIYIYIIHIGVASLTLQYYFLFWFCNLLLYWSSQHSWLERKLHAIAQSQVPMGPGPNEKDPTIQGAFPCWPSFMAIINVKHPNLKQLLHCFLTQFLSISMFHTPKNCLPSVSMAKVSPSGMCLCRWIPPESSIHSCTPELAGRRRAPAAIRASIKSKDLTIKSCHFIHEYCTWEHDEIWWNMELEVRIDCVENNMLKDTVMDAFRAEWGNILLELSW